MKMQRTELVFILDKSGLMYDLEEETILGFNTFLDGKKLRRRKR